MAFSIYDNNHQIDFNLKSQQPDLWPKEITVETFYGRKCAEFSWESGDDSLIVGIENVNQDRNILFGNFSDLVICAEKNGLRKYYFLNVSLEKGSRYMYCFDTILKRIMFINQTISYTFPMAFGSTNSWYFYFQQGASTKTSSGKGWFHYPFVNTIPSGFFSLVDRRCFEFITCNMKKVFWFNAMLIISTVIT